MLVDKHPEVGDVEVSFRKRVAIMLKSGTPTTPPVDNAPKPEQIDPVIASILADQQMANEMAKQGALAI